MYMQTKSQSGFSLIELMIVLVIIGILAGIVMPSYTSIVNNTRREDLQTTMLAFSQAMERRFTETNSYLGAAAGGNDTGAPNVTVFPSEAPLEGTTKHFDLMIHSAQADSYVLKAVPKAGSPHNADPVVALTSAGVKQRRDPADHDNILGIGWNY